MNARSRVLLSLSAALVLVAGQPAVAVPYGDFSGTNVDFLGVSDATQPGSPNVDPNDLYGAPTVSGNQLIFTPDFFTASAGNGGFDFTHSKLEMTIAGKTPTDTITNVIIEEFGDFIFGGVGFTSNTNVNVTMSGNLIVNATIGGPIAPVIISFSSSGDFVPVFDPAKGGLGNYSATDYSADSFSWEGSVDIEVAAHVLNATNVTLELDNILVAFSELGTTATIQKKVVGDGVVITVIPEPATALLLVGGLAALAIRSRRVCV